MNVDKQRELIRLWNRMREVKGPIAEEIRIQILEAFTAEDLTAQDLAERSFIEQDRVKRAA